MRRDFLLPEMDHADWNRFYAASYSVSVFDHWLSTDEEILEPAFLLYREARDKGLLDDFLVIERKFLAFYEALIGNDEVWFNRWNWDGLRSGNKIKRFKGFGYQVRRLIRREVRELMRGSQDLYLPSRGVRIWIGFDMTHWFCFERAEEAGVVAVLARQAGLHVLHSDSKPGRPEPRFSSVVVEALGSISKVVILGHEDRSDGPLGIET